MLGKTMTAGIGGMVFLVMVFAAAATGVVATAEHLITAPIRFGEQTLKDAWNGVKSLGHDFMVPVHLLTQYVAAQDTCPNMSWALLAGIGKAETDNGRATDQISTAGAVGPMQFLPSTFQQYAYPVPPGGANPPTPWDETDAVAAAARMLCADGVKDGHIEQAVYAYNHSNTYVATVISYTQTYTDAATRAAAADTDSAAPGGTAPGSTATAAGAPSAAAQIAINYATAQIGIPYAWGGDGPTPADPTAGFDCSGLTQAAYAAAGIHLPRVAGDQYNATPKVPPGQPLQPGDLVFYGTSTYLHHVGIYIGGGEMIDAPHTGARVRVEGIAAHDYYGATRPGALP